MDKMRCVLGEHEKLCLTLGSRPALRILSMWTPWSLQLAGAAGAAGLNAAVQGGCVTPAEPERHDHAAAIHFVSRDIISSSSCGP